MHQKGQETSTNSVASIFAWTKGLLHRAQLDSNLDLKIFTQSLETSVIETIENGKMTKDLAILAYGTSKLSKDQFVNTEDFILEVGKTLKKYVNIKEN